MSYKVLYTTQCPKCGAADHDKDNLSVYAHGTKYCFAGHGFIERPDNKNSVPYLYTDLRQGLSDNTKVSESVTGLEGISATNIIKYLWQFHLYEEDWKHYSLSQIISGLYTKEQTTDDYKLQLPVLQGIHIPTVGGFIIRQLKEMPKVRNSHFHSHWQSAVNLDPMKRLVICEDVFSGMKLHKTGFEVIALCGTSLKEQIKYVLARREYIKPVYIWLDKDEAGFRGEEKVRQYLTMFTDTQSIFTDKDPKWYTVEEIRGFTG